MKLTAMLHCTNLDRHRFNTLRRREQLPFLSAGVDETVSKTARYTLDDAFRLALFLDLVAQFDEYASIAPGDAANIVDNALTTLGTNGYRHPLNVLGTDLWVGVAVCEDGPKDDRYFFTPRFAGPLSDLDSFIANQRKDYPDTDSVRIILANASRAARLVRERAHDLGLPEAEDFSEIWPS